MNIYEILLATNKLLLTAAIWQSVDGFVFPIFFFLFIYIFLSRFSLVLLCTRSTLLAAFEVEQEIYVFAKWWEPPRDMIDYQYESVMPIVIYMIAYNFIFCACFTSPSPPFGFKYSWMLSISRKFVGNRWRSAYLLCNTISIHGSIHVVCVCVCVCVELCANSRR